jgi:transcriptional regulator with XRE-family HTH domain
MGLDPGPVVQRARLTAELQRIRRDAGKTQEEVARALGWSPSKLIRIEGGNVGISTTDLQALLRYCGVTDEGRVQELSGLARGARARGWWDVYRDHLSPAYSTYIGYEGGASSVRSFSPLLVPALLQTEEYAKALTIELAPASITEAVIEVRQLRQDKMFNRADPPKQHYVFDEAVIRRRVDGQRDRQVMPRQLDHLLHIAGRSDVTIELIPFEKGSHFGMLGEFTVLGFETGPEGVVFLENARGGDLTVAESDQVATYLDAFEHLRQLALPEEETFAFIEAVADQMRADETQSPLPVTTRLLTSGNDLTNPDRTANLPQAEVRRLEGGAGRDPGDQSHRASETVQREQRQQIEALVRREGEERAARALGDVFGSLEGVLRVVNSSAEEER